MIFYVPITIKV